jgi:transposase
MRYELADYEWIAIKPMLPNKPRGVPRVNDRRVLNGPSRRLAYKDDFVEFNQRDLGCPVPLAKIFLFFRNANRTM